METPTQKVDRTITWMMSAGLILSAVFLMIGCGDGAKRGTGIGANGGYVGIQQTTIDQTNLLYSALGNSEQYTRAQLALQFFAANGNGVAAQGELRFYGSSMGGNCTRMLPPGAYQVTTESPGYTDQTGIVRNLQIVARGSNAEVRMVADYVLFIPASPQLLSCSGMAASSKMWASWRIVSMNGPYGGSQCSYESMTFGYQNPFQCQ